jgi:hypothetical protein
MPIYPTGITGEAVAPCSHCNANEQGPEPGICHRNPFSRRKNSIDSPCCSECLHAAHGNTKLGLSTSVDAAVTAVSGGARQIPCSYCNGRGYVRV